MIRGGPLCVGLSGQDLDEFPALGYLGKQVFPGLLIGLGFGFNGALLDGTDGSNDFYHRTILVPGMAELRPAAG